jgi:hypothetical protein
MPFFAAISAWVTAAKSSTHLSHHLPQSDFTTLCFHYLQPDVDWHNQVFFAIEAMARRPFLIADAGFNQTGLCL